MKNQNNTTAKHTWDFFETKNTECKTLLDKIQTIGNDAFEQKNWAQTSAKNELNLAVLANYLRTSDFQTAFFAAVFYIMFFYGKNNADFESIQEFFSTKQIMLIKHKKEILEMKKLGLLTLSEHKRYRHRFSEEDDETVNFCETVFSVPDRVVDAIVAEKELPKERIVQTSKDFLDKINKFSKNIGELDNDEFFEDVLRLENECRDTIETLPNIIKRIPILYLRTLFYFICYDSISGRRGECDLSERISQIVDNSVEQNSLLKKLITSDNDEEEEKNLLLKDELIEISHAKMAEDCTASATNKGYDLMFGKDADLYKSKIQTKELILADKINAQELFFNKQTNEQIERIKNSLETEKFSSIQERLKEKGMAQGIAALFYGPPGTGKTESVQQLARLTGRDIYHVDISQTKTMWYGESPKLVKRIFTKYKSFCDEAKSKGKQIPILLFNEADAVISKRKDVTGDTSECDKESNAIQNVVLEQMEKLEGIMIATTNLANNMDAAFERRFLFKVEFQKPDIEGRAKIWQSKLKSLGESDAKEIAAAYDFSGGEIDNISRKVELEEVISGVSPNAEKIREFCQTEKINSESTHVIGFGV